MNTVSKIGIIILTLVIIGAGGYFFWQTQRPEEVKPEEILINYYNKYKEIPYLTALYSQIATPKEIDETSKLTILPFSSTILLLKKGNMEKMVINPDIPLPEVEKGILQLKEFWKEQLKDEIFVFEDKRYYCYISSVVEIYDPITGEIGTRKKWSCLENSTTVGVLESSISEIYENLIKLQENKQMNISSVKDVRINNYTCKLIEIHPKFFEFMKIFKENINLENVESGGISFSICIAKNGIPMRYEIDLDIKFKPEVSVKWKGKSEFNIVHFNFDELPEYPFIPPTER